MLKSSLGRETALAGLMILQAVCAVLFVIDVIDDIVDMPPSAAADLHLGVELVANLGLVLAIVVEGYFLRRLLRDHSRAERALSAASGAMHDLIQSYFAAWSLTAAEADVATFAIKGFSIAEIARLRGAAEGTVKSQLNAVYRKSGLAGRSQLVSVLIDDLLCGPLPQAPRASDGDDSGGLD